MADKLTAAGSKLLNDLWCLNKQQSAVSIYVTVRRHRSTFWHLLRTIQRVGIGGLAANINPGSDKTILTASAALSTGRATCSLDRWDNLQTLRRDLAGHFLCHHHDAGGPLVFWFGYAGRRFETACLCRPKGSSSLEPHKNFVQEEIRSTLKSGNVCYHSMGNILSSSFAFLWPCIVSKVWREKTNKMQQLDVYY